MAQMSRMLQNVENVKMLDQLNNKMIYSILKFRKLAVLGQDWLLKL